MGDSSGDSDSDSDSDGNDDGQNNIVQGIQPGNVVQQANQPVNQANNNGQQVNQLANQLNNNAQQVNQSNNILQQANSYISSVARNLLNSPAVSQSLIQIPEGSGDISLIAEGVVGPVQDNNADLSLSVENVVSEISTILQAQPLIDLSSANSLISNPLINASFVSVVPVNAALAPDPLQGVSVNPITQTFIQRVANDGKLDDAPLIADSQTSFVPIQPVALIQRSNSADGNSASPMNLTSVIKGGDSLKSLKVKEDMSHPSNTYKDITTMINMMTNKRPRGSFISASDYFKAPKRAKRDDDAFQSQFKYPFPFPYDDGILRIPLNDDQDHDASIQEDIAQIAPILADLNNQQVQEESKNNVSDGKSSVKQSVRDFVNSILSNNPNAVDLMGDTLSLREGSTISKDKLDKINKGLEKRLNDVMLGMKNTQRDYDYTHYGNKKFKKDASSFAYASYDGAMANQSYVSYKDPSQRDDSRQAHPLFQPINFDDSADLRPNIYVPGDDKSVSNTEQSVYEVAQEILSPFELEYNKRFKELETRYKIKMKSVSSTSPWQNDIEKGPYIVDRDEFEIRKKLVSAPFRDALADWKDYQDKVLDLKKQFGINS